jgi:CTP-dependent riboflavin kinase
MTGRKPTVSDEEILAYIAESYAPVVGASEVADEFDYSTIKGARKRLKQMQEKGYLDNKKLGQVAAWWITDAGLEHLREQE